MSIADAVIILLTTMFTTFIVLVTFILVLGDILKDVRRKKKGVNIK